MTKNKALEMALRIVNTCKKYEENCTQCPFNIKGCIVTDGNCIPTEWEVMDVVSKGIKERANG